MSESKVSESKMYKELNEEQQSVVFAPLNKNIRIIAGAGSGKTTTILFRIKYLLEKEIDPNTILLTTFNVDAAEILKDRLRNKLNIEEKILKKMFIGTIDSISYRFYKMYFSQNSYRGVQEFSTELLKFLKTDEGKEKILDKFKYVFFDEFQDANSVQFEILKKFSKKSQLTVIGDDAQNIYQWRGSNIDYILNFDKYFPNSLTFKLEKNYRSTPEIISFANESITNNHEQIKKNLIATKKISGIKPLIIKKYNQSQQSKYIIDKIKYYLSLQIDLNEIAVLSRNNYGLKKLEEEFEKSKLPYISLISDNDNTKIKIIPDHICLTTIHKAKGLEWKVVLLIDCDDSKFPSEIDPISIENERRLFYVGITRPKIYLEIIFTSNVLTRFVGELSPHLYDFPLFNKKYLNLDNKRNIKFETGVVKIISLLDAQHIEELRKLKILPELEENTISVSSSSELDEYITQYNLNQDYGTFIDRYICRKLNEKKDRDSDIVINSLEVYQNIHSIYVKYRINIINKLDKNNIKSIHRINKEKGDPDFLVEIDSRDSNILSDLCIEIIEVCNKYNLEVNDVVVLPKNYLPPEFKLNMMESYKEFKNDEYSLKNIYDISLCGSIRDGRRRLLYRDIFDKFTSNQKIIKNINKWCKEYNKKDFSTKIVLNDLDRLIDGEIDMIDNESSTLIDFKVSSLKVKLEWILQLLTYTSLLRNLKNIKVDKIAIYNPLLGTMTTFNIKKWSFENELLDYISKVRNLKINKGSKEVSSKEVSSKEVFSKEVFSKEVSSKEVSSKEVSSKEVSIIENSFLELTQEELDAMIEFDKKNKKNKKN